VRARRAGPDGALNAYVTQPTMRISATRISGCGLEEYLEHPVVYPDGIERRVASPVAGGEGIGVMGAVPSTHGQCGKSSPVPCSRCNRPCCVDALTKALGASSLKLATDRSIRIQLW